MSENPITLAFKEWGYVGSQNPNSRDSRLDPWVPLLSLLPALSPSWIPGGCRPPLEVAWYRKERLPVSYCASLAHVPTSNPVLSPLPLHDGVTLHGRDGCPVRLGL